MLLRQSEPADVGGHISAATMGPTDHHQHATTTTPRTDPLDDVFGPDGDGTLTLEDGHGDDDAAHQPRATRPAVPPAARDHPSDVGRLRREHTTAGYREGVTAAKAGSIQAGFDEGFGLGAAVGLRVGYLLGVLEGVAAALGAGAEDASLAAAGAASLLADARRELAPQAVFGPEYWDPDGTWRYEVGPGGEEGGEEVLFSHVAGAHPLVRGWTSTVEAEMRRWGLQEQVPLLRRREDDDGAAAEPVAGARAVAQPQPDAKAGSGALSW